MMTRFFDKLKGLIGLKARTTPSIEGKRMRDVRVSTLTMPTLTVNVPHRPTRPRSRNYQGPKEIRTIRKGLGL